MEEKKHPTLSNGKICYIEIPATDINQSVSFYKEVFGWNIRQRGDGAMAFEDSVGEVSGAWVTGRKASTEAGLLMYSMVDSVAATVDAVIAKGRKIGPKIDVNTPEITPKLSHPEGNVIGLYQETNKEQ